MEFLGFRTLSASLLGPKLYANLLARATFDRDAVLRPPADVRKLGL